MRNTVSAEVLPSELLSPEEYAEVRDVQNLAAINMEVRRRISTKTFSFLFECKELVINQIQEMIYLENTNSESGIKELIDAYSDLLPADDVLSVSMFIEFESERQMLRLMKELTGVEDKVYLVFDDHDLKAEPEPGRSTDSLESSLQYLKFVFSGPEVSAFKEYKKCTIEVRQKGFEEIAKIPEQLLSELKNELS